MMRVREIYGKRDREKEMYDKRTWNNFHVMFEATTSSECKKGKIALYCNILLKKKNQKFFREFFFSIRINHKSQERHFGISKSF